MAYTDVYNTGTVSVTAGSKTVTGVGTLWASGAKPSRPLDTLLLQGRQEKLGAVGGDGALTLLNNWTGTTQSGVAYSILQDSPTREAVKDVASNVRQLLQAQQRIGQSRVPVGVAGFRANAPPGSPIEGDTYVVGPAPTGAWVGRPEQFATWRGTAWDFSPSTSGDTAVLMPAGTFYTRTPGGWANHGIDAASLLALQPLVPAADRLAYFSGANSAALTPLTAMGRSLLGASNSVGATLAMGLGRQSFESVTIADDAAYSIVTAGSVGWAMIHPQFGNMPSCLINYRLITSSQFMWRLAFSGSVNTIVGVLSGTTGPDGALNIGGSPGTLHIENRTGASQLYFIWRFE